MVKPPAMGLAIMVQVKGRPGARRLWEQIFPRAQAKSRKLIGSVYYTSRAFPSRSPPVSINIMEENTFPQALPDNHLPDNHLDFSLNPW
jgi:hypothetical protein